MDNEILDLNPQFISLEKVPSQSFNIILDSKNCTLKFSCFNGYTYNWFIVDDVVLNSGIMCHCNIKLNQFRPKIFSGSLFFINQSQDGSEPYYTNFNEKCKLMFLNTEQTNLLLGIKDE